MNRIRVDVGSLSQSALRLRGASQNALAGLAKKAANHLAREAAEHTPVDTGKLRAGWTAAETSPLSAAAKNTVRYASFVEFDTRHWISGNIVPGRQFMHRAQTETKAALPDMVQAHLRDVIGRCFGD